MIAVRSRDIAGAEIAWFAPLCNGDFEYLGVHDSRFKSNWENTSKIVRTADRLGFRNILCPSSYQVGQDTLAFASAVAPQTSNINLLTAIRCGEVHPPMLARAIATLDHILKGRLTINIISSPLPGEDLPSAARYLRSREVIEILQQAWTNDFIDYQGEFYSFKLPTEPVMPYQQNGGPLLYFGGYSLDGVDLCARHCDVYLMWPATIDKLGEQMKLVSEKAAGYGRTIDFGLRIHVIVRESEAEARQAAKNLMSKLDEELGINIRNRALDAKSYGVSLQSQLREISDVEGYAEDLLWTGIGRGRSGCGAALVGTPEQIIQKIEQYKDLGFRSFIFSGYPHLKECELFGRLILPHLETVSLPEVYQRIPEAEPPTPLAAGIRK